MFHTDFDSATTNKGSHWVPILIMVALFALGTALFFALPYSSAAPDNPLRTDPQMPWFSISDGVLSFNETAYHGGSELTVPAAVAGQQVTALNEGCFENCALTTVFLPDTLQAIGADAFRNCSSLRAVDIPDSVLFIGNNAFSSCSAMEALRMGNQIQVIGQGAFLDCKNLRYVFFLGTFADWTELYDEDIAAETQISCQDGVF